MEKIAVKGVENEWKEFKENKLDAAIDSEQ